MNLTLANQDELENSEIKINENYLRVARILTQEKDLTKFTSLVMEFAHSDIADTSDKEDVEVSDMLWPVFNRQDTSTLSPGKRFKNGNPLKSYKNPILNPNNPTAKLIPRPLPRSTKHDYKQNKGKSLRQGKHDDGQMVNFRKVFQARNFC